LPQHAAAREWEMDDDNDFSGRSSQQGMIMSSSSEQTKDGRWKKKMYATITSISMKQTPQQNNHSEYY
jgi:hypothetical protein